MRKVRGRLKRWVMGDAIKSLENKTMDSKREMDILAGLDEMKSLNTCSSEHRYSARGLATFICCGDIQRFCP